MADSTHSNNNDSDHDITSNVDSSTAAESSSIPIKPRRFKKPAIVSSLFQSLKSDGTKEAEGDDVDIPKAFELKEHDTSFDNLTLPSTFSYPSASPEQKDKKTMDEISLKPLKNDKDSYFSRDEEFQDDVLPGIEVEIESTCSNDRCWNRKRFLSKFWALYRREILLACGFIFTFFFGVMIGACGTGQCRAGTSTKTESSYSVSEQASLVDEGSNNCSCVDASKGYDANSMSPHSFNTPTGITNSKPTFLGPNVFVFDPTMTTAQIQQQADEIFRQQRNNEMGTERYALFFQPGVYGSGEEPLMMQIGYYTEVMGLGANPDDVQIIGKVEVYNRCFEPDPYQDGKFIPTSDSENGLCFALNSFWRGMSNLSIRIVTPPTQDSCRQTAMFWAISQAASMRRVHVMGGDMSLMDYCSNPAYASGGFIADTKATKIISGSQQQFLTRNAKLEEWSGAAWNSVLLGVATNVPVDDSSFPEPPITSLDSNPQRREKPYVFVDEVGDYFVRVPEYVTNTQGISWEDGMTPGRTIPMSSFLVADPTTSVATMNRAITSGQHLLLTPGVYDVDETILVNLPDTVVLGIGIATLTALNGVVPLKVESHPGIVVAGVTVDAGTELSPILLQVGDVGDGPLDESDIDNPITLSDVYFRIGGPHIGKTKIALEINSHNVLVDHTWVWRADHGIEPFNKTDGFEGDNERWKTNTGLNGVVVNGDDVTCTGLFVEHFQEYNLIWNGERGRVLFFQNELPYEPPSQEEWMADDGTLGWAAYKVNEAVTEHELRNGGAYCYNRNNPSVVTENGFETPSGAGIKLHRIYTRNLSGPGTINSVVNGVGEAVNEEDPGPYYVLQYPTT